MSDGLNQKTVTGMVQDSDGILWVATFGGLNRFDGRTFESFTTRQGLRQNIIQALMVDRNNRLWAGDAEGGLTVIEDGAVTRSYAPAQGSKGLVRDMATVGNTLYITMQPGGLRRLSLGEPARRAAS
ncbi:MAG: two-component regulator propeller domain-containing protein, partial [Pseudomonadota bacterium]